MKDGYKGRVLFVGQCYYNAWYLSRELRKQGWKADVLNWNGDESSQMYYHGEDIRFYYRGLIDVVKQIVFYFRSIYKYDIFHFSNKGGITFGPYISRITSRIFGSNAEIRFLKMLGKKIVYTNNGCLDGVLQSSFSKWLPESVCAICPWKDRADVCSDENNTEWGKLRNEFADYQILLGGNRADFNIDQRIHEVPEFYCLDSSFWNPDILIPANYKLAISEDTVKVYHSVGNFEARTSAAGNQTIKSTHVYLPLIERLKSEGHKIELIFFHDVPNKKIRYYQAQADIFVDMLTFGWFGANLREAMMLGKPCICYLRPEWLEQARLEIPEYVNELPIVSATPETVYDVLKELILNKDRRLEIGRKSREFAVKWHSAEAGARRFDQIYSHLLEKR